MVDDAKAPFDSFQFWMIRANMPRESLRLLRGDDGMYSLSVQKGSAANPSSQFTRSVPAETAARLSDALKSIGAFSWEESYDDAPGAAALRWGMTIVFKEGVYAQSSKGGSAVPAGFDQLLEELYRLDFPRPEVKKAAASAAKPSDMLAGLEGLEDLGLPGMDGIDLDDVQALAQSGEFDDLMAQMQRNPYALQTRMREEFAHMSPAEQEALIDKLTETGMASRAYWERWLRG